MTLICDGCEKPINPLEPHLVLESYERELNNPNLVKRPIMHFHDRTCVPLINRYRPPKPEG